MLGYSGVRSLINSPSISGKRSELADVRIKKSKFFPATKSELQQVVHLSRVFVFQGRVLQIAFADE